MNDKVEIGSIVKSLKGRDSGTYYIVVGLSGEFVKIADGEIRKIDKPKLKKLKHVQNSYEKLSNIAEKLINSKQVFNSEIRSALRSKNEKASSQK